MAFGTEIQFASVHTEGIRLLQSVDIRYAESLGYRIKLLGLARRTAAGVELRVHPTLVPATCLLAQVEGSQNAVMVQSDAVGATLYVGAGAGSEPTASAVIADLIDVARETQTLGQRVTPPLAFGRIDALPAVPMSEIETAFYLRFSVSDRPGVVADLTRVLAENGISLKAMLQKPSPDEDGAIVDVIMLTHPVKEAAVQAALRVLEDVPAVHQPVVRLHLETLGG
jgi:homoserine dehydrogenase